MSKDDVLKNLYKVWGKKPLDHLFPNEAVQFYADVTMEGISTDKYKEYARKQEGE